MPNPVDAVEDDHWEPLAGEKDDHWEPLAGALSSKNPHGSGSGLRQVFLRWAIEHSKIYTSKVEEDRRFKIWCSYKEEVDPFMARDGKDRMYWNADLTPSEKRLTAPNLVPPIVSSKRPRSSGDSSSTDRSPSPTPRSRSKRSSSPTPRSKRSKRSSSPTSGSRSKRSSRPTPRSRTSSKRSSRHTRRSRSRSKSDADLFRKFREWAIENNRRYRNREEEESRFKNWCKHKKTVDPYTKRDGHDRMYWFADLTSAERMRTLGGERVPDKQEELRLKYLDSTSDDRMKYVDDTWVEFRKWASRHGRNYGDKMEENTRFGAYLTNKRMIDKHHKSRPGLWTYGYDLENMDKFEWECALI